MSDEAEVVLSPGDVARQLGVSPSGLRRLAVEYGKVHGELPKDASGTSRLWSLEAVRRLEAARALMAAGQARSIRDALVAVESGASPRVEVAVPGGDVAAALGVVATQLEAVLESNRRLEGEVAALRSEVEGLRALPASERSSEQSSEGERGSGAAQRSATDQGAAQATGQAVEDGPVVRAVRWLETRLRGSRGKG